MVILFCWLFIPNLFFCQSFCETRLELDLLGSIFYAILGVEGVLVSLPFVVLTGLVSSPVLALVTKIDPMTFLGLELARLTSLRRRPEAIVIGGWRRNFRTRVFSFPLVAKLARF